MKTLIRKGLLALSVLCVINVAQALDLSAAEEEEAGDASKSPLGCRDVGYQYQLNVVNLLPEAAGDRQSLYFLFNRTNKPLKLYQMRGEESTRSMYLNHVIRPQQWGVLATSEKEVKYICTTEDSKTRFGKIVNCADSIKVCEYARVKFGLNNRGNYWVVGSNSRGGAVGEVIRYGIIPR